MKTFILFNKTKNETIYTIEAKTGIRAQAMAVCYLNTNNIPMMSWSEYEVIEC